MTCLVLTSASEDRMGHWVTLHVEWEAERCRVLVCDNAGYGHSGPLVGKVLGARRMMARLLGRPQRHSHSAPLALALAMPAPTQSLKPALLATMQAETARWRTRRRARACVHTALRTQAYTLHV